MQTTPPVNFKVCNTDKTTKEYQMKIYVMA